MKKVSLRELVADKIIFAVLIAVYYWTWARNDWKGYYTTSQIVVATFTFYYFISRGIRLKKYKQETPDEMAEANLRRCDAICLKISVAVLIAVSFLCAAGRFALTTEVIGYCLVGMLVLLAIVRTIIFYVMALTTRIKEYREMQDLKQSDLAELVGVRRETIVNLERGKYNPSLKLAMDVAKVFHVTVEDLFSYDD